MSKRLHTVLAGETLRSIAKAYYGSADYALYIFRHNQTTIRNPDRVYPGQVIMIPHMAGVTFLC